MANLVHGCTVSNPPSAAVTIANGVPTIQNFTVDGNSSYRTTAVTIDDSPGNSNGVINRAECFRLVLPIQNSGSPSATAVTGTPTTMTAGVTVKTGSVNYGSLAIGASSAAMSYDVTTSAAFVCGTPITFNLAVSSSSGSSNIPITVPTCAAPATVVAGSIAAGDSTKNGRTFRDGIPSSCAGKPCPGVSSPGSPFRYDVVPFVNTAPGPICFTVTSTSACGAGVFLTAYTPTFVPANICTNYVGDIGSSAFPASMSFVVPGGQSFAVVAQETTATGCAGYSISVTGLIDDTPANSAPTALASAGGTICAGQSIGLTGSGGTSCSWTPTTGLDNPNSCTPNASPLVTTTYSLTVANSGFCSSSNFASTTVTVNPVPTPPTIVPVEFAGPRVGSTTICEGAPFGLKATAGYAVYQWYRNGNPIMGATSSIYSPGAATLGQTGSYTVTGSNGGCSSAQSLPEVVTVVTCPAPTISSVSPICANVTGGRIVTISGTGFQEGATVSLAGVVASVTNVTPTAITATAASKAAGAATTGNVVVTNPDTKVATATNAFSYAVRGDANNNGAITPADSTYLQLYVYLGGTAPATLCNGDANGNNAITPADAIFLNLHIFFGGPPPGP